MTTKTQAESILLERLEGSLPIIPANGYNITPGQMLTSDVEWPNSSFRNKKEKQVFIDGLSITYAESQNAAASFGGLIRTDGIFVILVRVPKRTGWKISTSIIDQLESLFRKQRIGLNNEVCLENIQIDNLGFVDAWYTKQINVFFYIEEQLNV